MIARQPIKIENTARQASYNTLRLTSSVGFSMAQVYNNEIFCVDQTHYTAKDLHDNLKLTQFFTFYTSL